MNEEGSRDDAPPPADRGSYPSELELDVVSLEHFAFRIRPIRPGDEAALVRFHDHLSDRTCYLRFFSLHRHLSPTEVERFTHVDYRDRLALVAQRGDRLIAVGRFDRVPRSDQAEVAFVVADECQQHGIGSLLLDELASAARARGIRTFVADTLQENARMLDVFLHSGFEVTRTCDYGTVSLRFPIGLTAAYETSLEARRAAWRITGVHPRTAAKEPAPSPA